MNIKLKNRKLALTPFPTWTNLRHGICMNDAILNEKSIIRMYEIRI